jgi:hypothetical protein
VICDRALEADVITGLATWWPATERAEFFGALLERADFAVWPTLFDGLCMLHDAGRLPAEWRIGPDGSELHVDVGPGDGWIVASLRQVVRDAAGIYMLAPRLGATRLRRIRHRRDLQRLLEELAARIADERPLDDLPDRVHSQLGIVEAHEHAA